MKSEKLVFTENGGKEKEKEQKQCSNFYDCYNF